MKGCPFEQFPIFDNIVVSQTVLYWKNRGARIHLEPPPNIVAASHARQIVRSLCALLCENIPSFFSRVLIILVRMFPASICSRSISVQLSQHLLFDSLFFISNGGTPTVWRIQQKCCWFRVPSFFLKLAYLPFRNPSHRGTIPCSFPPRHRRQK